MGRNKYGMGNRGLKQLICTTHGCGLRGVECWRVGGQGGKGVEGENRENCNSIINENIFLKMKLSVFADDTIVYIVKMLISLQKTS